MRCLFNRTQESSDRWHCGQGADVDVHRPEAGSAHGPRDAAERDQQ